MCIFLRKLKQYSSSVADARENFAHTSQTRILSCQMEYQCSIQLHRKSVQTVILHSGVGFGTRTFSRNVHVYIPQIKKLNIQTQNRFSSLFTY